MVHPKIKYQSKHDVNPDCLRLYVVAIGFRTFVYRDLHQSGLRESVLLRHSHIVRGHILT